MSIQCSNDKTANSKLKQNSSNGHGKDTLIPATPLPVTYHHLLIDSSSKIWLKNLKGTDSMVTILTLNRVDFKHLFRQDSILLPEIFLADRMNYSPFPMQMKLLNEVKKVIVFSYESQAFAAYQNGILIRWGPISMGKKTTPTPTGLFHTNWRSKKAISTIDPDWIMEWYFNLENNLGVSMHEYELPGYPASHACIRLTKEDAFWFYNWAESWILLSSTEIGAYGTPVVIYGKYPFGETKPWLRLTANRQALKISGEELQQAIEPFLPAMIKRQTDRDSLLFKK